MHGFANQSDEDQARWERLTEKQRACLDLVLERKRSKEIGHLLGISKDTVDQRITAARKTLGAADRDEAAIIYARLKEIYHCAVYDTALLPLSPTIMPSDFTDGESLSVIEVRNPKDVWDGSSGTGLPFEKIGRHDHGAVARVAIFTGIVLAAVLIWLGGLNIAETLSRLVSR